MFFVYFLIKTYFTSFPLSFLRCKSSADRKARRFLAECLTNERKVELHHVVQLFLDYHSVFQPEAPSAWNIRVHRRFLPSSLALTNFCGYLNIHMSHSPLTLTRSEHIALTSVYFLPIVTKFVITLKVIFQCLSYHYFINRARMYARYFLWNRRTAWSNRFPSQCITFIIARCFQALIIKICLIQRSAWVKLNIFCTLINLLDENLSVQLL